jgi:recombination protein RecA
MAITINGGNQLPKDEPVQEEKKGSGVTLAAVLAGIKKEKGDKVAVTARNIPLVKRIPTNIFEFDLATGGGFPCARYSIVYGPESSGKTNAVFCAIAAAQRMPPPCNKAVFVDLESAFDPAWAAQFGINIDELIVIRPAYGEEACDLVDAVVRAEDVAFVAVDSLAAIIGIKEVEQSAEKFDVGTSPLLIKRMCTKLVAALSAEEKNGHTPAVVLLNQTRMEIGKMFGNPEKMPGGKAMLFYSCLTVRLSGKNKVVKALGVDVPAFKETSARIVKAKVQVIRSEFEYDLCMLPHENLKVGDTDSWNSVAAYLKSMGMLAKADNGKGWDLFGMNKPTLVYYQDMYATDPAFKLQCQQAIVDFQSKQSGFTIEAPAEESGKE